MRHRVVSLLARLTGYASGGRRGVVFGALLLVLLSPLSAAAQGGQVTGRVVRAETREPLAGVQVYLEGTRHGALTAQDGHFQIDDVRPGIYRVVATSVGFATAHRDNVRVAAGATATVEIELRGLAFTLDGVVTTGVVDPVSGIRVPFTVGRVTADGMPVPASSSVAGALQGKVAGVWVIRGHGPGADASIQLGTPKTIFGSNAPLYVVDGVALSSAIERAAVDVESLDIERIEVIEGAAATALYGSRAKNGVISISTARGNGVQPGRPRISVRNEFGVNRLARRIPIAERSHYFLTNDDGYFIDEAGNVLANPFDGRVIAPDRIMDKPWGPYRTYDNFDTFFDSGRFRGTTITIAQNTRLLDYSASFNSYLAGGVLRENDGFERTSGRIGLDLRPLNSLSFHLGGYRMRSHRDAVAGEPFEDLLRFLPDTDIGAPGQDGEPYMIQPGAPFTPIRNPLYWEAVNDDWEKRERTLASAAVRFTPASNLSLSADFGYDRLDRRIEEYRAKGTRLAGGLEDDPGRYYVDTSWSRYRMASFTASLRETFGPLTFRGFYRGTIEREEWARRGDLGSHLEEGRDLDGAGVRQPFDYGLVESRTNAHGVGTVLDFGDRYIADVAVRWEGVGMTGLSEQIDASYYRVGFNWRVSRERWFQVPGVSEFQLRFAHGTAGGWTRHERWQYAFQFGEGGSLQKFQTWYGDLRPEATTENEFALRAILADRVSVDLSYARSKTEDVHVPRGGVPGSEFGTAWTNASAISGRTYEATIEALVVDRSSFGWRTNLVLDRSRNRVERFDRPCYGENMDFYCKGMVLGEFWTTRLHRKPEELLERHSPEVLEQFQVNDDGLLVWVGEGNSYRDGLAKNLWGTTAMIDGYTYTWGLPFQVTDELGAPVRDKTGDGNPDLNFGWSNTVRWNRFTLFAQVNGQLGGDIYNTTRARMYDRWRHADVDQAGKPDELKKPIDYYRALYNSGNFTDFFLEDGSYAKLAELSIRYDFDRDQFRALHRIGVSSLSIGLVGRNLYTLTRYTGFDPEVGTIFDRRDVNPYPAYRTFTGEVRVTF